MASPNERAGTAAEPARLRGLVERELTPVWRLLRRVGLSEPEADDATQQVFIVAARRLSEIDPARERAFLFSTALNIGRRAQRTLIRRREDDDATLGSLRDSVPGLDELLDQKRARAMLDELLGAMSDDLRVVFVLYEIEELTMAEIAQVLDLPPGTVASRLRRARGEFQGGVTRIDKPTGGLR
jgi:RNA polymerase sigma-70 factor (ECF subfamily)